MGLFRKREAAGDAAEADTRGQRDQRGQRDTREQQAHSPYLDGRREWLERYGSYIQRARQWRGTALAALALAGLSMTGNVIQATQTKIVPYIIEVDKLGKAAVSTRADEASAPSMRLVQAEIAACIADWRTVTADVELQRKMIRRLGYFFAGSATGVLKGWYERNNPYEIAQSGRLVHVEVKSLPLPVSRESYRVEWLETTRSHTGVTLDTQRYEATLTVRIVPPETEEALLNNPAGLYITNISATRLLQ